MNTNPTLTNTNTSIGYVPGTPSAELDIAPSLVHALLAECHPDLAHLPVRLVDSGWDNTIWRLGNALAIRLPRRQAAVALIEHEQRWLPEIAHRLPLPIPVPLRVGAPAAGYPWPWSIVPWMPGVAADIAFPNADQGLVLASFLRALHVPPPPEAPRNPVRGTALAERRSAAEKRFERLAHLPGYITPALRDLWKQALEAPVETTPTWLHGDLHSRNVLVDNGAICAVIDWGDMTQGDPATDLAAIWTLLPNATSRAAAIAAYGSDSEAIWHRARGWAIILGLMLLENGLVNDPRLAAAGEATLQRLAEGP